MQTFEFLKVKVEESTLHCARVGYGTHWANFNKKVHKPPYWTLEVARVKKARLGAKMHLVSFHIFCKLEYFGL